MLIVGIILHAYAETDFWFPSGLTFDDLSIWMASTRRFEALNQCDWGEFIDCRNLPDWTAP
jgi:hypothetical protein